jgi:hypothetical protein
MSGGGNESKEIEGEQKQQLAVRREILALSLMQIIWPRDGEEA